MAGRAEDTVIVLSEILDNPLDSSRCNKALGRLNFLHQRYQGPSRTAQNLPTISNADLLYTLSLFVFEPMRWTERYEWRGFSQVEKTAMFIHWREIGARMGIDFNEPFPVESNEKGDSGSEVKRDRNPGQSIENLEAWSLAYEKKFMKFSETNAITGEKTRELLLRPLPTSLKWFGEKAVSALLDDRLRESMGWARPSQVWYTWVQRVLEMRGWIIKHFFLPRLFYKNYSGAFVVKSGNGWVRLQRKGFLFEPW